ncbi:MAG: SGNH/GDSL hydrolase family protein [Alphaproteobacteria bacterium]|nr:MAG: SGNH/GDSL hydrolase family protein [Alphaproteobacteria bacterium]
MAAHRRSLRVLRSFVLVLLALCAVPQTARAAESWTRAWTASLFEAPAADAAITIENATLRTSVRVAAGGAMIRLRLSNEFGPLLELGAVTVRTGDGPFVPVTFGGKASTLLPGHGPLVSDPVPLAVAAFDRVDISFYIPGAATLSTVHMAPGQPTEVSPPGNFSAWSHVGIRRHKARPLLAGIDVLSPAPRPVIVAFGDSITDSTGCANDAVPICRWSDVLARRLAAAGMPHVVVTQAISGNRILSDRTGPSALQRFDRDVLAVPGVSHMLLLEGINDIGTSGGLRGGQRLRTITAEQLIEGYRQLALRAHEHGIKVIAMTLLPFAGAGYHTAEGEAIRLQVNDWIRTSGTFDAVIDMERVMADPDDPSRLAAALQRGDNLHPNDIGQTVMGEAVPLDLFR